MCRQPRQLKLHRATNTAQVEQSREAKRQKLEAGAKDVVDETKLNVCATPTADVIITQSRCSCYAQNTDGDNKCEHGSRHSQYLKTSV